MARKKRKKSKKKRKLTPHNRCVRRGLKAGHEFSVVGSTCGRNPNAFRGPGKKR